ncbi:hypothetical protein EDI_276250 [Entamoeba dispar SAW760]|uniref:Uncharacterized protein n=1 Tax=Entamoeba dispar (strain ATCC PRA-260 / SAW760) TaxID=370354 RepID=B0EDR1_ENTDS|nr:uncharacterized protein EDI_276250 [Entamoeba dispar SAW760]EDR27324.1 hypothetical protein EDI_276250 [Entamoeba dispar SAW760]|eukprot:EDR27324.1 hypothetical protein EDI_276250 [Entamoeba dispar SAW760]
MGDFLEGEHCWCRFQIGNGEIPWPSIIKKIYDQRTVIVQVFGTPKLIKTKIEWLEHGYKLSPRKVMEIASKMSLEKEKVTVLYDGLTQFKEGERIADLQVPLEMENFWIQQTLELI